MKPTQLYEIQTLRAIASISVLFGHAQNEARNISDAGNAFEKITFPWNAGVDLFFIISGFIMVYTSTELFGRQGAIKTFLTRRLIRIVPLYWFFTSLTIIVLIVLPSAADTTVLNWNHAVASYLFIPTTSPSGGIAPILDLGWTLNYEMYFYLLFAAFIFLPMTRALMALCALFASTVVIASLIEPEMTVLKFWFAPIVLEFSIGMIMAWLYMRGFRINALIALTLGIAGIVALSLMPKMGRLFSMGIPAAMIFAAFTFSSAKFTHPRALIALGDSSYTLYLSHPFALGACALLWKKFQLDLNLYVFTVAACVISIVSAHVFYLLIERPGVDHLRARFR